MMLYIIMVPVVLGLYVILMYNKFIRLRNSVHEAFSTMDVYMKKRYDLVPNLVETVKGYAQHEQETFRKVVDARNRAMLTQKSGEDLEQRQEQENMLSGALKSLFALSESYPELKADSQFLDLQKQLQKIEEDIAQSRKYYNAVVKEMNTSVESFPSNLVAQLFNIRKSSFFTIDESDRGPVSVSF